jgi:starch synthase (maltosyl-transferring)
MPEQMGFAIIERVEPEIDGGRFAIKRVVGETVTVEADVFTHGHDLVAAALLYRPEQSSEWCEAPMQPLEDDRWSGAFTVTEQGRWRYCLQAWVDRYGTWAHDLEKRVDAGQDVSVDLEIGAVLVEEAIDRATGPDRELLESYRHGLLAGTTVSVSLTLSGELAPLLYRYATRPFLTTYGKELPVVVDRERAGFSAWYELFPRSWSPEPGRHGTLRDVAANLRYVASMGFDVLYLPPIHPIGRSFRKGRNNMIGAAPEDTGSPWAIGAAEGGHKSIHPQLGTLDDFQYLVGKAREHGLEVALDIAFQVAPDHPYAVEHPEWFRKRPDGTIQYAENPPKKYQDIYPFDFASNEWPALWRELKSIVDFWIEQGVKIFRVDNPHTKAFAFWEWLITSVKSAHSDVLFLAEAFTRPPVMYYLAKLGFTQSYTYFTWRNTKWELTQYLTELTGPPAAEFFRPSFWPNTPDILHEYLQLGGRPASIARAVLAATLSPNWGVYGPAFELVETEPVRPGSEEYLYSEKYQIKQRDLDAPGSIREEITRLNRARRTHPALQRLAGLRFHTIENDQIIAYTKATDDGSDVILTVVNLDYQFTQSGFIDLPLDDLGIDPDRPYSLDDLLNHHRYEWRGSRNYVELRPRESPAHLFHIRQEP